MPHPMVQLQNRVERGRSTSGTVTEITGDTAVVATRFGMKSLLIPAGLQLIAGDRVRVEANNIAGRIRRESELPVYQM